MKRAIAAADLYNALDEGGVRYFCGVPDSTLASFSDYLDTHAKGRHDVAVNEGAAVGLALGYHIATGDVPLVYMQNAGLGNAINPLVSLADAHVFRIPLLLLVGWRGCPGTHDEPQHIKQGAATTAMCEAMDIPFVTLSSDYRTMGPQVQDALTASRTTGTSRALLVEPGVLESATLEPATLEQRPTEFELTREDAIAHLLTLFDRNVIVVATTGKISRELCEIRDREGLSHNHDLLVVGGMGHASSVAAGIARQKPHSTVVVLDGDGALLMQMGALATHGVSRLPNLVHVVLNNGAHESVGGQPTVALDVDLPGVARACRYANAMSVATGAALPEAVKRATQTSDGPAFIEIKVSNGSRSALGRPSQSPRQNKEALMTTLGACRSTGARTTSPS